MSTKVNLLLVQPALMHYRIGLFRELSLCCKITLIAEDYNCSNLLDKETKFLEVKNLCLSKFKIFWQKGILGYLGDFSQESVLLMNSNPRYISNYIIYFYCKFKGIKIIFWNHGHTAGSPAWRTWLRFLFERLADRNLLYYKEEKEIAIRYGIKPDRLFYSGNTVDTKAILKAIAAWPPDVLKAFSEKHNLINKDVIIFIGRLTKKARFPFLEVAFNSAANLNPNLQLIVIGGRPQFADSSLNENRVTFVEPTFDDNKLAPWMLLADLFVYPGAVGLSLIHAFAYGLPALIHNDFNLHMPEANVMEDGKTGALFLRDSVDDAVYQINRLLSNKQNLGEMGRAAKDKIFEKYRIEQMARNVFEAVSS